MKWFDPRVPVVVVIVVVVIVVKRWLLYCTFSSVSPYTPPTSLSATRSVICSKCCELSEAVKSQIGRASDAYSDGYGRWWGKWWWCNNVGLLAQFGEESGGRELCISYNQMYGGQGCVNRRISRGWHVKVVLAWKYLHSTLFWLVSCLKDYYLGGY